MTWGGKEKPYVTDTDTVTITITWASCCALIGLMETGLYGRTIEQTAEELLRAKIREVLRDGHLNLGARAR